MLLILIDKLFKSFLQNILMFDPDTALLTAAVLVGVYLFLTLFKEYFGGGLSSLLKIITPSEDILTNVVNVAIFGGLMVLLFFS